MLNHQYSVKIGLVLVKMAVEALQAPEISTTKTEKEDSWSSNSLIEAPL